jgi:hypothetical protein
MKKAAILALSLILGASAQAKQLAFPGAEGYGCYAAGGRGGDVYHVTTLADYNDYLGANEPNIPGSLRYGLRTATGPRTIVFDVSGYIDLRARLQFGNDYVTIAGQTAPGDGITIRHWDLRLYDANNVIIRYLRVRPGHFTDQQNTLRLKTNDPNHLHGGLDCLSIEGSNVPGGRSTDVIIDHCSLSWCSDEISSVTADTNDITVQWTLYTEPLNWTDPCHPAHAYCSLMRPTIPGRYTHHHNLYADCIQRVTRFGNYGNCNGISARFDWVNNVAFNWGTGGYGCTYSVNNDLLWNYVTREASTTHGTDGEYVNLNFIKNYFIAASGDYGNEYYGDGAVNTKIWDANNFWDGIVDGTLNGTDPGKWAKFGGTYNKKLDGPFAITSPLTIDTAPVAYDRVLEYGGNWLQRDPVDNRILRQIDDQNSVVIIDQTDVGGYPALSEVNRPADFDTDGDGMPTAWEEARWWLDPNDPNDRNYDRDSDGYTNLEEYLNYLVVWKDGAPGDYDDNGKVDYEDLQTFMDGWLVRDDVYVPAGDLYDDDDHVVDLRDFAVFAANWTGP